MRDPFDSQPEMVASSQNSLGKFVPLTTKMLGNSDTASWNPNSRLLIRHQLQRESGPINIRGEDNSSHMDPELTELYSRSQLQEEELVQLRKQISDACLQELQLLKDKHILERRLSDLRMALDEKQGDHISDALKDLIHRKGYIKENIRLAHELQVAEEEIYIFTSSLLGLLAENNVRLPLLNAFTISSSTKRLYQNMERQIRSSDASLDQRKRLFGNQPGDVTSNIDRQPPKFSKNQPSQSHLGLRTSDYQYNHYPADLQIDPTPNRSRLMGNYENMNLQGGKTAPIPDLHYREFPSNAYMEDGGNTAPNFREDNTADTINRRETADSQFYIPSPHERQASPGSEGDVSLPGIEGFQITGDAKPGSSLKASGYPTNGTSLCIFQWVRHHENGTRQSIEGATVPDYVVTADDVDTFLAVDCIPMDLNGRQGELVRLFANNQNKITCGPEMQHEIDTHISAGRAIYPVLLLIDSSEAWELATLILKRTGYQIKVNGTEHVIFEEKYSPDLQIKVPHGQTTQFVLMCSEGTILPFSTNGTSQAYSTADDIRLRDIIVLTLRHFQAEAVDGKRKGKE